MFGVVQSPSERCPSCRVSNKLIHVRLRKAHRLKYGLIEANLSPNPRLSQSLKLSKSKACILTDVGVKEAGEQDRYQISMVIATLELAGILPFHRSAVDITPPSGCLALSLVAPHLNRPTALELTGNHPMSSQSGLAISQKTAYISKLVIIIKLNHWQRAKRRANGETHEERKQEIVVVVVVVVIVVNHQRKSEDSLGLLLHFLILGHKLLVVLLIVLLGRQVLSGLGIVDLLLASAGTTDHIAGVDLLEDLAHLSLILIFIILVVFCLTHGVVLGLSGGLALALAFKGGVGLAGAREGGVSGTVLVLVDEAERDQKLEKFRDVMLGVGGDFQGEVELYAVNHDARVPLGAVQQAASRAPCFGTQRPRPTCQTLMQGTEESPAGSSVMRNATESEVSLYYLYKNGNQYNQNARNEHPHPRDEMHSKALYNA
ncbi:hypothetical protein B0T13DRAFT_496553 [Neurospora crassa]|nr:hypothetical protein B0T13DRAFT_498539 [Neurospora crassa]KAK3493079.1 hypothetical protein B0T13DRAFT_496553 [Neurospora crassa]